MVKAKTKKLDPTFEQPCPECGSTDTQKKCWGMYVNYCNKCGVTYDVPPGRDAKEIRKQLKKKGKKKK